MDLTIHHARLDSTDQTINVGIAGGRIAALQVDDLAPGRLAIEADGALLSPAFIDPHFHLENALLNDAVNTSGTLREAINIYAEHQAQHELRGHRGPCDARLAHGGRQRHIVDAQ